jgi:dTDP-4-amino-4,6-dideoxygalactose transaminase
MIVGRYDYPSQFADIDKTLAGIRDILMTGRYVLGREVEDFERRFATFLGVDHVVGVNSGTDGLILALMALDIGPGDEVITQANTFYATVAAIRFVGARPVLVDPIEDTALIDPDAVAEAITERTKAIIPVHLFGKPTDLAPLRALAQRFGLFIVEDAAQCHGARACGVMTGTGGDIASFSFHPSKNLAAAGNEFQTGHDTGADTFGEDSNAFSLERRATGDRCAVPRGLERHAHRLSALG